MGDNSMASGSKFDRLFRTFRFLPLHQPLNPTPNLPSLPPCPHIRDRPFADLVGHALDQWTVSNHIFPAAYPRSMRGSALSPGIHPQPNHLDSTDRMEIAKRILAANSDTSRVDDSTDMTQIDECQLFISVNRYYRKAGSSSNAHNGITLIFSHANGLHKETWEPTLAHLLQFPEAELVSEIWALDCVNQGDSAVLNRDTLGERFDWADHARDLLQFIIAHLPEAKAAKTESLPKLLKRQVSPDDPLLQLNDFPSSPVTSRVIQNGLSWRGRQIGLVGHSLGGCASALAATTIPQLIKLVILIDAVIIPSVLINEEYLSRNASLSALRRDRWKARAEAHDSFIRKTEFFGRWDPAVLERYVNFGLTELDDELRLKCDRLHETSVFADPLYRPAIAFRRLQSLEKSQELKPFIREHTPKIRYVFPGPGRSVIEETFLLKHIQEKNSEVMRINEAGHLIVQECPLALSKCLARFLEEFNSSKNLSKL
ncbi:hypothetical protein CROQUDRAFT_674802 [Cronartium quercuum f. sp. fusiforme G11]|uniref:AB hydrolase-1 domain-containing protein n=1 Tax=Cronartium quercuum f. sp. fusiforme G11 TaxID=708437 RepID=A0A9P6T622_9BASI|nr:hypothetical protein CROQUDRAFT_674802 [Cronartium quercuum f. sp. fusiforme G11]